MITKVLKILGRSLYLSVELILILLIFLAFAIRTSQFQTWLAQKTASYFSKEWNTVVSIDKVDIIFFDKVEISGVYVEDLRNDTLLYSQNLLVNIQDWSILDSYIEISGIDLQYSRINLKTYQGDSTTNFQFISDYFESDEEEKESQPFRVNIERIGIDYVHFSMVNENETKLENGLDFNHLDIAYLSGNFSDFGSANGKLFASIDQLKVYDKSGFKIKELTTQLEIKEDGIFLNKFKLLMGNSRLEALYLNLEFDNPDAFDDFLNDVVLRANITSSHIELSDVAYFVPDLWGIDQSLELKAYVLGPINKLIIKDLDLKTLDLTRIEGYLELPNFSNMEDSYFKFDLNNITTTAIDLKKIQLPPYDQNEFLELPNEVQKLGLIKMSLLVDGKMKNLKLDLKANTQTGSLNSKIALQFNEMINDYTFKGFLETTELNLGVLAQDKDLGNMSGKIIFDGSGTEASRLKVKLDGTRLSRLKYKGHNYNDLNLDKGLLTTNDFKGHVVMKDQLLDFDFNGYIKFGGKNKRGEFNLDLRNAYLVQLNLLEGDPDMNFRFDAKIAFNNLEPDKIYGQLKINDFHYFDSIRKYDFEDITFNRSEDLERLSLESSIADLQIMGNFNFKHFYANIIQSLQEIVPNMFVKSELESPNFEEHFVFNVNIKDFDYIQSIFIPKLTIENNTQLKGSYYADEGFFRMNFNSGQIQYEDYIFQNIKLKTDLADKHFDFDLDIDKIILNDSLTLPNFKWISFAENNTMKTSVSWDSTTNMKDASLAFDGEITQEGIFTLGIQESYFHIKDDKWDLSKDAKIYFDSTSICIEKFVFNQGNQSITLNGVISEQAEERLMFVIKDFNVNYISSLFGLSNEFESLLNGQGYLADPFNQFIFGAVNEIKDFSVDQQLIGDLSFSQIYNSENEVFDIGGNITREDKKTFDYEGTIDFNNEENQLDLKLIFDRINIAFISAFVDENDYSNIRGILDGNLTIKGMFNEPKLRGDINFLAGNIKVGMLGTNFGFGGKITVRDGMIALNYLPIFDEDGNQGNVVATVFHDNFSNWNYDIFLDLEENTRRFKVMNTQPKEGDFYYGLAYISGVVNVSGNESDVYIDVNAKTRRDTRIVLPLSGPTQVSEQDFIVFINTGIEEEIKERYDFTGIHMNLNFDITKDAEFRLVFDESTGDVITAVCEGPMNIIIDRYYDLKIYGSLEIDRGDYLFGMSNIVSKSFVIARGGTINWIGDPFNANIDISTIYEVRTPMKALMSGLVGPDQIARYASPEIINCILTLKGTLMAPEFEFDIEAPRADDQARAGLQRIKKSEDELKKQFFSLLLLNKFIPPDGEGGPGMGGAGSSAVSEMISNQLNNLLSEMSDEYQIGIKYSSDQESHSNEFGVGVTTELLNDKLIVSGTVGVASTEATGESASSIIGDILVEYKLNEEGTFTVTVFNESNEFDVTKSTLGRFSQGFGLRYRESFQTIAEFELIQTFLNLFRKSDDKWTHPTREDDKIRVNVPKPEDDEKLIEKIINGAI